MELLLWLSLLLAVVIFFLLRRGPGCPPGPPWVPLLGSLPFLNVSKGLLSWVLNRQVTAHPLTQVRLGRRQFNVINDLELAKELFQLDEFSGRNTTQLMLNHRFWNNLPHGIIMTQGAHWTAQRRFSLKTLKDFGFGRKSIEDSMHSEVDEMIDTCFTSNEDILLGTDFNIPIINVLWQIVASKRFSPDKPKDMQLINWVTTIFTTGLAGATTLLPLPLFYLLPRWLAKRTIIGQKVESMEGIRDHVIDEVKKHQEDLDPQNTRDYIDAYLLEERKEGNTMNVLDLCANIQDFFTAGTETSSTTLKWIVQYLVLHQDVQDRCRAEIQRVVGEGRVSVGDLPSLPFLQVDIYFSL
jgi:cytochrome P450